MRKLTFTGSTEIGKQLMSQCAGTVKKVSLELGGNAPFIVFDDADLDEAVKGAIASKYRNTGQTCVCANRLLVQNGVYDAFAAKLADAVKALKVADGMTRRAQQGPLIDMSAVEKVEDHIRDALSKGARVVVGGERHSLGGTLLPADRPGRRHDRDEGGAGGDLRPGGAAVPLRHGRARRSRMANDTEFGLAAYFYSRDIGRVWRVAEALEYGIVGINEGIISTEVAPFGGMKESGIGREGSKYGIEEYMEIKYLCMGGVDAK